MPDNVGYNAYNLRNAQNLNTVQAISQLNYKSFLHSVTRDWNELAEELRNTHALSSFKRRLHSDLNAVPNFFFDAKRLCQIYHVYGAHEDTQHF